MFAPFKQPYRVRCKKTQIYMVIAIAKQIRARDAFNPCQTYRMELFAKIVNGSSLRSTYNVEVYSEPCHISQMERFAKILNDLTIFPKCSILDV